MSSYVTTTGSRHDILDVKQQSISRSKFRMKFRKLSIIKIFQYYNKCAFHFVISMNGVIDKILKTKTNKERQIWINNLSM
jgi:hypothetical protein